MRSDSYVHFSYLGRSLVLGNNSVFPSVIPAKATSDVAKAGIQVDYALDPWSSQG